MTNIGALPQPTSWSVDILAKLFPKSDDLKTLDFFRIIASVGIVIYHYRLYIQTVNLSHSETLNSLRLCVDFFFVISGFVISYVYIPQIKGGRFAFRRFVRKRLARLVPLHLLTLLFYVVLGTAVYFGMQARSTGRFDWSCLLPNLLLIHSFGVCKAVSFNTVSWSISAEMVMYVCFPILAWLALRVGLMGFILVDSLLILSLTTFYGYSAEDTWLNWASQFGFVRAFPSFIFGMILYLGRDFLKRIPSPATWLMGSCASFIVLAFAHLPPIVLLPICYAIAALGVSCDSKNAINPIISKVSALGQLTYSVYMLHLPVSSVMMTISRSVFHFKGLTNDIWVGLTFFVTFAVATLSYHFLEKPARKWLSGK
jgi:peptidoglycan/LPS O-acetylase OafA/YrhL